MNKPGMRFMELLGKAAGIKRWIPVLACVLFALPSNLMAQDDEADLSTEQIQIEKYYQPVLANARKLTFEATPAKRTGQLPQLRYDLPEKVLNLKFEPANLRALALPREKYSYDFNDSYFKVGFGTQLTPLIDAVFNDGKYEKYNYGAAFQHLSSRGAKLEYQDFANNHLHVFGNLYTKRARMNAMISYQRDKHFLFGYQNDTLFPVDSIIDKEDIKRAYSTIGANFELNNHNVNKRDFYSNTQLGFYKMWSNHEVNELNFTVHQSFKKIFKNKHYLKLDIEEDFLTLSQDTNPSDKANIFWFNPAYTFDDDTWNLTAGITGAWDRTTFYLFPDIHMERRLYEHAIIFYSGWKRMLRRNSYHQFANENPYVRNHIEIINTRMEDRYVGFKGTPLKFLTYNLMFDQKVYNNLALFVNDSTDMKQFTVVYDPRPSIITLLLETGISATENLHLNLLVSYFRYEMDEQEKPWHKPSLHLNLSASYKWRDKLITRVDFFALDRMFARGPHGEIIKIKGIADLNLGAEYQINEYLSAFGNINNLLGTKYQRWYLYPQYGFNALAGIRFSY